VIVLSGLSQVNKPDRIAITEPLTTVGLRPGDTLLRYTEYGEGFVDFWAGGRWYRNIDGSFITEPDGSGCQTHCKALVAEPGEKRWWFRVRLPDGRIGWTAAYTSLDPN
jgi:hypothetical protein